MCIRLEESLVSSNVLAWRSHGKLILPSHSPAVLKYLHENKLIDGDIMTVTGKSLAENLSKAPDMAAGQDIIRPLSNPIKSTGHLRILRGNLAPGGCVSKITGKEGLEFTGKARVFDNEDDVGKAIASKSIKPGEKTVIVLRYLGPKGGPGGLYCF